MKDNILNKYDSSKFSQATFGIWQTNVRTLYQGLLENLGRRNNVVMMIGFSALFTCTIPTSFICQPTQLFYI